MSSDRLSVLALDRFGKRGGPGPVSDLVASSNDAVEDAGLLSGIGGGWAVGSEIVVDTVTFRVGRLGAPGEGDGVICLEMELSLESRSLGESGGDGVGDGR